MYFPRYVYTYAILLPECNNLRIVISTVSVTMTVLSMERIPMQYYFRFALRIQSLNNNVVYPI